MIFQTKKIDFVIELFYTNILRNLFKKRKIQYEYLRGVDKFKTKKIDFL
jgi:hypothetical protein